MNYKTLSDNLFYVTTPYKDIYTTVYLIKTECGYMLFDTASFDEDIDNTILPFLSELGVDQSNLKYVFISHAHKDHMGGLERFLKFYPDVTVITESSSLKESFSNYSIVIPEENETYLGVLRVILIPGHSACSQAIYDTRDNSLITGDCLQLYGIYGSGNWACNITLPERHFEALNKIEKMDISAIYTAHDYHPLGQFYVGKEKVISAIENCREPLCNIKKMIEANPSATDEEIAELYNKDGKLPKVGLGVIKSLRSLI
ncbi:MAG: MBL fold metallo-hydrolase [Clostridia bacterium]|nr:MBL fold metallo-hydrolase [Clostridia bacterium]